MAKPITDDYNAIDPSQVALAQKPEQPENWSVYVQMMQSSYLTQLRFVSQESRDEFYKRLVDAMGA